MKEAAAVGVVVGAVGGGRRDASQDSARSPAAIPSRAISHVFVPVTSVNLESRLQITQSYSSCKLAANRPSLMPRRGGSRTLLQFYNTASLYVSSWMHYAPRTESAADIQGFKQKYEDAFINL